jgi:hypothetical protein
MTVHDPGCENLLYDFKGARSAPGPGLSADLGKRPATSALTAGRRWIRPEPGRRLWGPRDAPGTAYRSLALRATSASARTQTPVARPGISP